VPSKPRARPGAATRPKANTRGGAPAQERELRAQGQKTMRKLLEAGRVVFERRGFHAARVDDVVKRARTSHGTFYLYFANKEDLFKALAVDAIEEMSAVAKEMPAVTPDAKGYADLEKWMGRLMDAYSRHGTVIRAWTEGEIADSDLGALGLGLLTTMAGSLASHVQSDDEHFEPQIAGIALLAMIERCNYFVQSRQLRFEREALVSTLSSLVFAGCFAPQAMAAAREGARKRG
jgi:AcrR family transcriptional regulator